MNEIKDTVRALRDAYEEADKVYFHLRTIIKDAADLIESLQADAESYQQVKKTLSDEGFSDLPAMIARYKQVMADANEIDIAKDEEMEQLRADLAASQRRERAAVEDLKLIVDAVREAHCDETCCFACKFDCDTSINDSGVPTCECPGFERDDCFEGRGPQEAGKGSAE